VTYTETDVVASIERLSGNALPALTQNQRDQLDQFHAGGPAAVDRILPTLRLAPEMTVLDVGSGLGRPARQVARSAGRRVTVRLDGGVMQIPDRERTLRRSLPNPIAIADRRRIRDARRAGPRTQRSPTA
jgi:protein-L-isoaspartate O-methyltransferase